MRKTKWMAAVLSVCLILVMLPTVAFAEGHAKSTGNAEHDNPFGDIHEGDYYYDAVLWAVEQGITSGTSATTFSPDTSCTRSQMVTFLWRSAGSPHAQYTVSPFEDVSSDTYYYEAVIWAAEQGITSGTSSTTFSPDTTITRAQAITFIFRAMEAPAPAQSASFSDVPADAYYASAVSWAAEQGVTGGTSADTFSPDSDCTRGQIVTFIFRSEKNNTPSTFEANSVSNEFGSFRYWLYTPSNPTEQMPLIVYLHGGSGKGDNLSLITSEDGFPKYLQSGELGDVRAYVLIPQLPSTQKGWADVSQPHYNLIQAIVTEFHIDTGNISLTGHSMGGTGTWNLAAEYPTLFARIAPLSGSARLNADAIKKLDTLPVWAFVGSADTIVPPDSSEQIVKELEETGGTAQITIFNGADHFSVPSLTYLDKNIDLVGWLIGETDGTIR